MFFPQWSSIGGMTTGASSSSYQYIDTTGTSSSDAWMDFVIQLTFPANTTWTSYPDIVIVNYDGTTNRNLSQFTLNSRSTASTAVTYSMVQSLSWGNARLTMNGFNNVAANANTGINHNPYSTTTGKVWFSIPGARATPIPNWGNRVGYKNVPQGTKIQVYAARHIALNNYVEQ